ncbi:MAG TPA: hypothetical protein VLK82_22425 [Candidatus Tectomicrobia bacterium]|nr:hypothetical protein [Candidatus Tectomicrobia bacterium]
MTLLVKAFSGLSLVVLAVVSVSAQGKVNFSGTWILDKSKSDASQLMGVSEGMEAAPNTGMTMVVEQQGSTLKVTRVLKARGEERKEIHTYKTDGGETTNTGFRGESVVARAFWEGDKLVVVSSRTLKVSLKETSTESRGVWSLGPGGKTLTIDARVNGPRGEQRLKAVFDKQ